MNGIKRTIGILCFYGIFVVPSMGMAQEFKPGDIVEFEHFREMKKGKIERIVGGRMAIIEVEFRGRMTKTSKRLNEIKLAVAKPMPSNQPKFRTWTDSSGSFKVEAALQSKSDREVVLLKKDGKSITVPLNKLSAVDLKFLESMDKPAGPSRSNNSNPSPFGNKKPSRTNRVSESAAVTAITFNDLESAVPDQSTKRNVDLAVTLFKLPIPVEARRPAPERKKTPIAIKPFPQDGSQFAKSLFAVDQQNGIGVRHLSNHFENASILQFFDTSGKELSAYNLPDKKLALKTAHFTADNFITFKQSFLREPGRLDIWKFDSKLHHLGGWEHSLDNALMGKDGKLVTYGKEKGEWIVQIVDWKNSKVQTEYRFKQVFNPVVELSHQKNVLVIGLQTSINFVDLKTGNVITTITLPKKGRCTGLKFSNDGTKLATSYSGFLNIYDLKSLKLENQILEKDRDNQIGHMIENSGAIRWLDDEHLLISGKVVVSCRLKLPIWSYSHRLVGGANGEYYAGVQNQRGGFEVKSISLPEQRMLDAQAKFQPQDLLVIQPGMKFSVKTDVGMSSKDIASLKTLIGRILEKNGCSLDDKSPYQIHNTWDISGGTRYARMRIKHGNEVLWSYKKTSRNQNRPNHRIYDDFANRIPQYFYKLHDGEEVLGFTSMNLR